MAENQFHAFNELRRLRGGFSKDYRNKAAHIWTWILMINGFSKPKITEYVRALGRECRPPLTESEIASAVKYGLRVRKMSYRTIADRLGVTQQEAEAIPAYLSEAPTGTPRRQSPLPNGTELPPGHLQSLEESVDNDGSDKNELVRCVQIELHNL